MHKKDDIYKDIAKNVGATFDTSNYELDKQFLKGKNEGTIGLMKDELDRKIMIQFFGLRAKIYSYLIPGSSEDEKAKGTKKCAIKRKLNFKNYKNCSTATQLDNKINF